MPYDPELVAETKSWLAKAHGDLGMARVLLEAEPAYLDGTTFHAQQAAEKAMKALLTWHSMPFRKTHSLEEIGEQCLVIEPTLRPVVDKTVPLTQYAWRFRYPGEPEEPDREQAEAALAVAGEVYDAILARLPEEVRP